MNSLIINILWLIGSQHFFLIQIVENKYHLTQYKESLSLITII